MILVISIVVVLLFLSTLLLASHYKKSDSLSYVNNSGMRTEPRRNYDKGTIFCHEDDFCQVQLIPIENTENVEREGKSIREFARSDFDGQGFKKSRVRERHKVHLNSRTITVKELDKVLEKTKKDRHSRVSTGYGQHEEISINTIGYGSGYSAVFYDFDNEGIVQNIWLTNIKDFESKEIALILKEIGDKWNLILADWNGLDFVDLKNKAEVEKYLDGNE